MTSPTLVLACSYNDGRTAKAVDAIATLSGQVLLITAAEGGHQLAHWNVGDVHLTEKAAPGVPVRLRCGDGDERLLFRGSAPVAQLERAFPNLHRLEHHKGGGEGRTILIWGAGALASILLLIFVIIPVAAETIAATVPPSWEARLGDAAADQMETLLSKVGGDGNPIACDGPVGQRTLERLARRIAPGRSMRIDVLNVDQANAFALPGGRIMILRGLIDEAKSPGEVAGVLAHEIGHVVLRHSLEMVIRDGGTAALLGLVFGDIFGGAVIAYVGQTLIAGNYSREAEEEADAYAVERLNELDIDAKPLVQFFDRLVKEHGETEQAIRYFSSHPLSELRSKYVARNATGTDAAFTDGEWQAVKTMCG